MKAVGIICEYNPFHNGHLYHIKQVQKLFKNHILILIVSGPFTERGDVSVLTKWEKAEIALSFGVDLVVELPFIFATGSADLFAKGAVQILQELQVESIVFGSESNDISLLTKLASIQLDEVFQNNLQSKMKTGVSYPKAVSDTLEYMTKRTVRDPNDLLGVSYIKEILKQNASIKPITIQRTNSYHETKLSETIASASAIRKSLKENNKIDTFVPEITLTHIHKEFDMELFFPFLKYKIISERNNLIRYHGVFHKLIPRIQKQITHCRSLEELIKNVKSKNETYNQLKRIFLSILCGLTKEEANFYKSHNYIRILGFSESGKLYLNKIKKEISIPLLTNYSNDTTNLLQLDLRVHQIYTMIFDSKIRQTILEEEIKKIPIYYKTNPLR